MGLSKKVLPANCAQIDGSLVALSFERMFHEDSHSHALTSTKLCFAALTCQHLPTGFPTVLVSQVLCWRKPCSLLELALIWCDPYQPGSLWARQKWITDDHGIKTGSDQPWPATTPSSSIFVHHPSLIICVRWFCWHMQGAKVFWSVFVSSWALATSFSKPAFSDSALTWMGKERHGLKPWHSSVVCHLQSHLKILELLQNLCTKFSKAQHPTICQEDHDASSKWRGGYNIFRNNHWWTLRQWLYDVWSESCQASLETLHWLLLQESFRHFKFPFSYSHSETVLTRKQHAKLCKTSPRSLPGHQKLQTASQKLLDLDWLRNCMELLCTLMW